MANALYDTGREAFLLGDIDMAVDTIKAVLIDTGVYTVNLATHDFYNDVSAGAVGTPVTLTSKTTAAGVFDAADTTFTSVTGATVEALIIYKDTGTPSTSQLIAYIDTGTGLPVTPNGGDILISWSSATERIFKL